MSDNKISQPGLDSLSKSFEPAAIEAQWGPEWEKRGYGNAGYRGTSAPNAESVAEHKNFAIQLPPPNVTARCTWATRSTRRSWTPSRATTA